MPALMYGSEQFSKAAFWDTCYGDSYFRDSIPERNLPNTVEKQCRHGYFIHIFVNQIWNPNDKLRYEQHVLMEGLSATNTHPNIVRSCGQHHPNECHFDDK